MKLRILAIGKPKLGYAEEGVAEYCKRLKHAAPVTIEYLKVRKEAESVQLLSKSEGSYRIAIDEKGEEIRTLELEEKITKLENRGDIKTVSFLIGGAEGHATELKEAADERWSLSKLTLQHELALVVLLEQLYRAYSIKRGEPYHREG